MYVKFKTAVRTHLIEAVGVDRERPHLFPNKWSQQLFQITKL